MIAQTRLSLEPILRRVNYQKHCTTARRSQSKIAVDMAPVRTHLRARTVAILALACLFVGGLTACGGGTKDEVVAKVGSAGITTAEINHWMATLAGGDYYEVSRKHTMPAGLVSEPADYARCTVNLNAAVGSVGPPPAKPSSSLLLSKCRQLHYAVRQQAAQFLVEAQWLIGLAAEEGFTASDREIKETFAEIKKQEFPSARKLQQFLADNRRSLADELFVVKLDVIRRKLQKQLTTGGKQAQIKLVENGRTWTAKTTCQAGYVVAHCRQYKGERPTTHDLSAAVLIEQVAAITGSYPCIGRATCI